MDGLTHLSLPLLDPVLSAPALLPSRVTQENLSFDPPRRSNPPLSQWGIAQHARGPRRCKPNAADTSPGSYLPLFCHRWSRPRGGRFLFWHVEDGWTPFQPIEPVHPSVSSFGPSTSWGKIMGGIGNRVSGIFSKHGTESRRSRCGAIPVCNHRKRLRASRPSGWPQGARSSSGRMV